MVSNGSFCLHCPGAELRTLSGFFWSLTSDIRCRSEGWWQECVVCLCAEDGYVADAGDPRTDPRRRWLIRQVGFARGRLWSQLQCTSGIGEVRLQNSLRIIWSWSFPNLLFSFGIYQDWRMARQQVPKMITQLHPNNINKVLRNGNCFLPHEGHVIGLGCGGWIEVVELMPGSPTVQKVLLISST
jgi:hypothetical protein